MATSKFVYVIVDTPDSSRVVQPGHPPTQMSAYRLPVTGTQADTVAAFVAGQNFPADTVFGTVGEVSVGSYVLSSQLQPGDVMPGGQGDET